MAEERSTHTEEQEKKPASERPPVRSRLWARTGFGDKTLWDFLQLLIVPLVLVGIGFALDLRQQGIEDRRAERARQLEEQRAQADRRLEEQRTQDAALQAYLDQMNNLLLEHNLRNSKEDSGVRTLASARTLTVLGRLDPSRKTAVMRFLVEAELVQSVEGRGPLIRLGGVNLSDANLNDADLSGVVLSDADLSGAKVSMADLRDADLEKQPWSPEARPREPGDIFRDDFSSINSNWPRGEFQKNTDFYYVLDYFHGPIVCIVPRPVAR